MKQTYILVNPAGTTTEVDATETELASLIKQKFRIADEKEVTRYQAATRPLTFMQTGNLLDVHFVAPIFASNGYGASGEALNRAMLKNGVLLNREFRNQVVGLVYHHPYHLKDLKTPVKILYTMFESTSVPEDWPKYCKEADLILTPSVFCQKALATRGIKAEVLPLGYDDETFEFYDRKQEEPRPFTFLHYDAFNIRKGWDLVFEAFNQEFEQHEPVRLIFKTVRATPTLFRVAEKQYPNLVIKNGDMTGHELNTFMRQADCFVFPSRGEGFGLPPVEAMATGLPGIIPNGSGMSEYFDNRYFYDVKFEEGIPSCYDTYKTEEVGTMIKAEVADLRRAMREAYLNQPANYERGKAGAEYVKDNYPISKTALKLAEICKQRQEKYTGKSVRVIQPTKKKTAAVIMDNTTYYSGGRYLNWLQAFMLAELDYDVTVYTSYVPKFVADFDPILYKTIKIETVADLGKLDVKADLYFGSPQPGVVMATRLGEKYQKPVLNQVFDPPGWMNGNSVCTENEIFWLRDFKDLLKKAINPNIKILTLTKNSEHDFSHFLGVKPENVIGIHPPINSRLLRMFDPNMPRKNWVVSISRNDKRKAWAETIQAFAPYCRDYELHIITHTENGMLDIAKNYGIPTDRIVIHEQVNDAQKFMILMQAKALISSSHFEGFGMWAIEARAAGVPVVCYDLLPFNEIEGGMFKAKVGDVEQLSELLGAALATKERLPVQTDHDFEVITKQLCHIIDPKCCETAKNEPETLKITPVYIVLNEEKFITASLKSVLKRPEVERVVIVEGADKLYPLATKTGLSIDKTAARIRALIKKYPDKIIYKRIGLVENKTELRQKTLDILHEEKITGFGLRVDGDEVWEDEQWENLVNFLRENLNIGTVHVKYFHFWKSLKQVAVGSMWDEYVFRVFRLTGAHLQLPTHEGEPQEDGVGLGKKYGRIDTDKIHVHHYGAMKDAKDIHAKLTYYERRDAALNVRDTWTEWKPGEATQWTHGGGTVQEFTGKHPVEITQLYEGELQ